MDRTAPTSKLSTALSPAFIGRSPTMTSNAQVMSTGKVLLSARPSNLALFDWWASYDSASAGLFSSSSGLLSASTNFKIGIVSFESKGTSVTLAFALVFFTHFCFHLEVWETQRKTATSVFNHHRFQTFVVKTIWNKVEKGLIPVFEHASELGTEMDLKGLFQHFTFDSACILVLGHDPASLSIGLPDVAYEKEFNDAEEALLYRHILPESFWKLQRWLQVGKEKNYSKAWETLDLLIAQCISSKPRDTTSAALTWFFWLVATNPSVENKIREEITTKLHPKEDNRLHLCFSNINDQEMKKLVYLHGALCESLRLFPPVPIQHKASVQPDILPSGNKIGANTRIILAFYAMGRMETIWGKDCLEFKPERWITEQGGTKHEPSYKFITFNSRPRSCLGKDMTFIQMKIIAITTIYNYNVQVVDAHAISPCSSIVLHMKDGLKVRVTKRRV
ncbi:hypothetical protein HYC85_018360 [Camellia sinensis]|uniref:Uncharacterized protein n=1 Tax=Camellia sinensis TaxID=4442 RepID=A0A7J7GU36_CAMSI|nr:hypothetical protein HYC85_018360 [Camellia sinensis]